MLETFGAWRSVHGPATAAAIDAQREALCGHVTRRLASGFPALCLDPQRTDAAAFQQQTYTESPRRLHRLIQVVLLTGSLSAVEREYRWAWDILPRYGVERRHMLSQVRWYFEALREYVALRERDEAHMQALGEEIVRMVEQITSAPPRQETRHGAPEGAAEPGSAK